MSMATFMLTAETSPVGVLSEKVAADRDAGSIASLKLRFTESTVDETVPVGVCEMIWSPFSTEERKTVPACPGLAPSPPFTFVVPANKLFGA